MLSKTNHRRFYIKKESKKYRDLPWFMILYSKIIIISRNLQLKLRYRFTFFNEVKIWNQITINSENELKIELKYKKDNYVHMISH